MTQLIFEYEVEAPSNIAFVKYWGKYDGQLPMNPSVSMTLSHCVTKTKFQFFESDQLEVKLRFDNSEKPNFEKRVYEYFSSLSEKYPTLKKTKIEIQTTNNFPHSAGIASSASGFAAIAMGAWSFLHTRETLLESKSSLARRGSGSASRSIEGPFCFWDGAEAKKIEKCSIPELSDIIVLIDKGEKSHSSSAGHELMSEHPYREQRISNANKHCEIAQEALNTGDFNKLGEVIEKEALELHALMMTSAQPFWLMKPMSLKVMAWVKELRAAGTQAYFTLDAGANIHIISKLSDQSLIANGLKRDFPELEFILDQQGHGAVALS